ncbi:MAG: carbon storage regulator CsrA [Clostridia bacterium]|nr:carbon storage regulator CsrA [Clostridia bacterium]
MLVVTRKLGESILIGDDIEIIIVEQQNGKIKIGIEAPKNIKILRKEILEAVKTENISASVKKDDIQLDHLQNILRNNSKKE